MDKIYIFIIMLILVGSCSKENSEQFKASVELNSETLLHFDAAFRKGDDGLFTLFLSKDGKQGPEHRFKVHNFHKEVGRTLLMPVDSARGQNLPYAIFTTLKFQRDVGIDSHQSINHKEIESWIEIDHIGFRKIEGKFQVVMETASPTEHENPFFPYLTDTLLFREGKFTAKRFY